MEIAVYARMGIVALGLALAYWMGYRVAAGVYEERLADAARGIAESYVAVVEAARLDTETESERRAKQAREVDAAAAAAREAKLRGQINALRSEPRPDCAAPAERVLDYAEAVRAANRFDAAVGVPGQLPGDSRPD